MPRVQPQKELVHNKDLGGTKVTIALYVPQEGVAISISLPYPCTWKGKLVPAYQEFKTDEEGKVVVMLPPSNELISISGKRVNYLLETASVGKISFRVPKVKEWVLGSRELF